jgi:propionate CoA-transferase
MFDYYDGGGLDMCFLGAAQINAKGDVNVSRMSQDHLTGPGGFIDISQSTQNICFMMTLTTKGLKLEMPGDGTLKIAEEGQVKKFVPEIFEKTFSGDEAVRRGQNVLYVTERAVFRRYGESDVLELIEIAPGVDLQKDVLDQMDFTPKISPNLKEMDSRIFKPEKMETTAELFGTLEDRLVYHPEEHTVFVNLFGVTLNEEADVRWFVKGLRDRLKPLVDKKGKINMVANYDGFDLRKGLEPLYAEVINAIQDEMYKSVKRYTGHAFKRAKLKTSLHLKSFDPEELFKTFDSSNSGTLTTQELRDGFADLFHKHLTPANIRLFSGSESNIISKEQFIHGLEEAFNF